MPQNANIFLADAGNILFVKGESKYQNQGSLSNFFNNIPPEPEKVLFNRIDIKRFYALVYYKSAEDTEKVKKLL